MVDGLLQLEMQLLTADGFADDVGRLAPVGVSTAAGAGLLWIAAFVFDDPRGGFQKPEMALGRRRHNRHQYGERKEESGGMFHGPALL